MALDANSGLGARLGLKSGLAIAILKLT